LKNIQFIDRKTGKLITEKPPGEGFLKFLYYNPLGELALNFLVKRKLLSVLYGKMMDSSKSVKRIEPFVNQLAIDMTEAEKSIKDFTSFNDFFYRKLKTTSRPIEGGLISPADAKVIAFENIENLGDFYVKGQKFTLSTFLQNEELAKKHKDSALLIFRLAPNNYHRFHFPYSGKASQSTKIKGYYLSVSPYALTPNFTRVFCENKREYTLLTTENKGEIILSPVGATMVGTIIGTYTPNSIINKGDEMGYFSFGGSSVVMLIEKGYFKIDSDILENSKNKMETAVKMGEQIGF
jgi:phosphatidylserine decarboxylase